MKSTVIKTNNQHYNVEPENGVDFSLDELKRIVKGYIEIVYLSRSQIMVCNEEGKCRDGFYPNPYATMLVRAAGIHDTIYGDVLVCDNKMVK